MNEWINEWLTRVRSSLIFPKTSDAFWASLGPRESLQSGLCSLTRWLVFTLCSCSSSPSSDPLQPCVQRSVCTAAVFPRTPATVSPAGEGPTAPAVSLGSLGVERGHGSGWGGAVPCGCWVLCPGLGLPSECGQRGGSIPTGWYSGWRAPGVWGSWFVAT